MTDDDDPRTDDDALDGPNRSLYESQAGPVRAKGGILLAIGVALLGTGAWFFYAATKAPPAIPGGVRTLITICGMLFSVGGLYQVITGRRWVDMSKGARVGLLVLVFLGVPLAALLLMLVL